MNDILSHVDSQLAVAIGVVWSLNVLLTSVKKLLDRYAAKSVADGVVSKICALSSKGLELITANSTVLPPKAKAELDADQAAPQS